MESPGVSGVGLLLSKQAPQLPLQTEGQGLSNVCKALQPSNENLPPAFPVGETSLPGPE